MYKKRMIIAVVMAVCFMTACTRKTDSEGGVVRAAVEDNGYQESRTNENETGSLPDDVKTASDDEHDSDSSSSKKDSVESPGYSFDREVSEIFTAWMPALAQGLSKPSRQRMVHRSLSVQMSMWRE